MVRPATPNPIQNPIQNPIRPDDDKKEEDLDVPTFIRRQAD